MEASPLKTLEELLAFDGTGVPEALKGSRLRFQSTDDCSRPATLVCHDMAGGYLQDRFEAGCILGEKEEEPYFISHWWNVDIFAYFSHHMVTIPPVGWIHAAHLHGTLVLGTFITEWAEGAGICAAVLSDPTLSGRVIQNLVLIAQTYNFDGWLLNIENEIQFEHLEALEKFVSELSRRSAETLGRRSRVIWYDSVISSSGRLKWQDELNALNQCYFDACDGIFLNYGWTEASLKASALLARERRGAVFVGVDVFGRGCFGGGGFNTDQALALIRRHQLSAAIFAPGWTKETFPDEACKANYYKFWSLLGKYLPCRPLTLDTAVETNFSHGLVAAGVGRRFNLGDQQLQPHCLCGQAAATADYTHCLLPDGQSALRINISRPSTTFRLFCTKLSSLGLHGCLEFSSSPGVKIEIDFVPETVSNDSENSIFRKHYFVSTHLHGDAVEKLQFRAISEKECVIEAIDLLISVGSNENCSGTFVVLWKFYLHKEN